MSRALSALLPAAAVAVSCGGGATGPGSSLCETRHGVEVCVDQAEYERNEMIAVTTTNVSDSPIFKDSCAIKPVGVTDLRREFEELYNPRLHCGSEVTRTDIIEHMVEIAPGASFEETLGISQFAFQGWYRVNVWILNAEGSLAVETPAISGIFRVFPASN